MSKSKTPRATETTTTTAPSSALYFMLREIFGDGGSAVLDLATAITKQQAHCRGLYFELRDTVGAGASTAYDHLRTEQAEAEAALTALLVVAPVARFPSNKAASAAMVAAEKAYVAAYSATTAVARKLMRADGTEARDALLGDLDRANSAKRIAWNLGVAVLTQANAQQYKVYTWHFAHALSAGQQP